MGAPDATTGAARRVLVTGASSGIGAAVARRLARDGAELWLTYASDEAGAAQTAAACAAIMPPEPRVTRLDLREPASIDALLDEVGRTWGRLDALVNNGGVCPYTPVDEISVDEWDAVMATNARGTFLMCRGALPLLRAAEGDRAIVNVSSVAGQLGGLLTSVHYAASKAAILAITRSLARLLAPEGIRVNAVTPGAIASGITDQLDDERLAALTAGAPLGRVGRAEEVADTIALLAGPASSYTTGATYDVNGGTRID